MKTLPLTLLAILFYHFVSAQANNLAIQAYKDAEEAFNNGKYEIALSNLDIAETMLKNTNPKIQGLKLKTYKQLALADSTNNFNSYSKFVTELKTKKSDLANEALFELDNFSKEKVLFLENKKNSLIIPIEKIIVGQSFSTIQKQLYDLIDFDKPKEGNQFLHYVRRAHVSEKKTGLYEIVVDKISDRIVKVVTVFKSLTSEEFENHLMTSSFMEIFGKFDMNKISTESKIEKINKKEYNVVITLAKIDDTTSYFRKTYIPTKVKYKDIKDTNSIRYFLMEGYEVKL